MPDPHVGSQNLRTDVIVRLAVISNHKSRRLMLAGLSSIDNGIPCILLQAFVLLRAHISIQLPVSPVKVHQLHELYHGTQERG